MPAANGAAQRIVLIVDDEDESRRVTRTMVESLGYQAFDFRDGETALDFAGSRPFHVALLDVRMPAPDGHEVARRLRASHPRVSILMVTGLDDLDTRVRSIEAGADDVIVKPVEFSLLGARLRTLLEQRDRLEQAISSQTAAMSLARAVEAKSRYTIGHSRRAALWAEKIARELGFGSERTAQIQVGALLHDVGKIGIPDALLNKPSSLTDDELTIMRAHPVVGEQILKPLQVDPIVVSIAAHHHERVDGGGYPSGWKGDQIPIEVRLVAVADAFDALTSHRPYRRASPASEAVAVLRRAAAEGAFDADVVEAVARLSRRPVLAG
jgi:putative two-component system response regulator